MRQRDIALSVHGTRLDQVSESRVPPAKTEGSMPSNSTSPALTAAQWWVVVVTALAAMTVTLDSLVVTSALGAIRTALHASIEELEWTVTAYVLTFAVLLMTAAALGDRFGRRRMFITGLAVFAVASAACALAPDVGALIAARAVQGAGAALLMPLALALLGAAVPADRRSKAIGVFAGVTGLAVPVGPLLGGAIVTSVSWPWIFWINIPIAAVLIYSTMRQLGGAFGVAVVVAAFASAGGYASSQTFNSGFIAAMVACAVLSLAGALSGLVAPGRIPPARPPETTDQTAHPALGPRPDAAVRPEQAR
ncbi:MFS transporter [Dactylosporangium siamense]|uniref:MFS transporter n=1 Tax=Dactylosporangium siamense TaxID=685454 RepID=UPI00194532AC|nr:MFS transporter [Dactylosporangium siamense]